LIFWRLRGGAELLGDAVAIPLRPALADDNLITFLVGGARIIAVNDKHPVHHLRGGRGGDQHHADCGKAKGGCESHARIMSAYGHERKLTIRGRAIEVSRLWVEIDRPLMGKGLEAKIAVIAARAALVDAAKGKLIFKIMREDTVDSYPA
jgi:hypothetical protein